MNTATESPALPVVEAIRDGLTPTSPDVLRVRLWPTLVSDYALSLSLAIQAAAADGLTHWKVALEAELRRELAR